jgi:hypothetical protein
MPRYFYSEEALNEWAEAEKEYADEMPENYEPVNLAQYDRTADGMLTEYRYAETSFDVAALQGEEARVYGILRERGIERILVSYDGGGDEGFAELKEALTRGVILTRDELARELCHGSLGDKISEFDTWYADGYTPTREQWAIRALDGYAHSVAMRLLGQGYGTGDYALTGRLIAELTSGRIWDEDSQMHEDK